MLSLKTKKVLLSSDTVISHKKIDKQRQITPADYYKASFAINSIVSNFKDGSYHTILLIEAGVFYRAILKETKNKDEIFLVSLVKIESKKDLEKQINKLKRNKGGGA